MAKKHAAGRLEPQRTIVRGGTDAHDSLSSGLPTPNLSTGEHNIHSPLEWTCVEEMATAVQVWWSWRVLGVLLDPSRHEESHLSLPESHPSNCFERDGDLLSGRGQLGVWGHCSPPLRHAVRHSATERGAWRSAPGEITLSQRCT